MSLSGAAAALGLPEALVQRSAEARAAETGQSVEDILAAWAGGEAGPTPAASPAPEPAAMEEGPAEADSTEPAPTPEPAPVAVVADTPATPTTTPSRAPVPAEVSVSEAAHLPEVVTVPTAGIRERTNFITPRWLSALMLIVPIFALFALGGSSTGECGEATELTTDVITGDIVNCDGSEFTGGGAGGGATDFIALGGDLYTGSVTAAANCAGCHGANGQGSAAFPALTGVLTTFGACADHIEWVRLGSDGFRSEGRETYGDTNKPVSGGMPGHASLTDEQLASVVAFERVRFGGQPQDDALVDCGLVEAEGEEGGEGEGETPPLEGGETPPTETTVPAEEASAAHAG